MTKSQKSNNSHKSPKSPRSSSSHKSSRTTIKLKNKKGGGIDQYSSDDYKDVSFLDSLKFNMDDVKTARGDLPPFPSCSIM